MRGGSGTWLALICCAVSASAYAGEPVDVPEQREAAGDAGPSQGRDGEDGGSSAAEDADAGATEASQGNLAEAEPVEVTVRGERLLLRDPTSDATRVGRATLRESTRPSLLESLSERAADVYVAGRGAMHGVGPGASGAVMMRGLGGSPNTQVLVVEDGVPDAQGIFGHPIPDAYVPALVDEVLLVKGGDSVLYGTNALGGAIVLRNRWRREPGFEIENDAAYGSFATARETVSVLARTGRWDVAGAFHALTSDGHRDGAGGNVVVGHAAARYRVRPDLWLTARSKTVHLEGADPGPASHPTPDHAYEVWREQASIALELEQGGVGLLVRPYAAVGWHELHDGFRSEDHRAGTVAELKLDSNRVAQLLVGLAAEQVGGDVSNRITGEQMAVEAMNDLSAYDQLTLHPVESLSIVLGTRAVASSRYGPVHVYKAGARWRIIDGLYVRSRLARNYRQPTLRELYLPFPTANPELRPEKSLTADVGMGYLSEHFDVRATGYRTEADDLIKYFGAWPAAEVVNIDHATVWGIEGEIRLKDLGPVSLFLAADWRHVGRFTRQNPNAKVDAAVSVDQEVSAGHRLGGSVSGQWVHGLYMANYEREPIDDVLFVDASLRYRHEPVDSGVSIEPYLIARNLFDQSYAYVEGYPMPRFGLLVGLRLGYGQE